MADFSPKDAFTTFHKEESQELMRQREARWFTLSLNSALAQVAHSGAEAAELKGARRLIDSLLNLPDKASEARSYPIKELKTYDAVPTPIQTEE